MADLDDIRARLDGIAEELGDLALVQLRAAVDGDAAPGGSDERTLTRARRAVEKASGLLQPRDDV